MNASCHTDVVKSLVTLQVPARLSYLRIIRQGVMDLCARAHLSELTASQLEMAVDEACANIIEHSYGACDREANRRETRQLGVSLMQYDDRIAIELHDHGCGFDPAAAPPAGLEQYLTEGRERGLGMIIIRQFVDELDYERGGPEGNCLRLVKRI